MTPESAGERSPSAGGSARSICNRVRRDLAEARTGSEAGSEGPAHPELVEGSEAGSDNPIRQLRHLDACAACAAFANQLTRLDARVAAALALPSDAMDVARQQRLAARILAAVADQPNRRRGPFHLLVWRPRLPALAWPLAAAAAIVLVVFAVASLPGTKDVEVSRAVAVSQPPVQPLVQPQIFGRQPSPDTMALPALTAATNEPVRHDVATNAVPDPSTSANVAPAATWSAEAAWSKENVRNDGIQFAMHKSSDGVELRWDAKPGAEYVVRKCTTLQATLACPTTIPVRGNSWTDRTGRAPQRADAPLVFYVVERRG